MILSFGARKEQDSASVSYIWWEVGKVKCDFQNTCTSTKLVDQSCIY